ncbi:uncharacterized protein LOC135076832 [Ostrinia nubilalis]|uniref:uncharacterized protein LOC135076832 n=1 Tax=Ostrinia nubilalis TaxID=29057 RepID=UPI0030826056
MNKYMIVFLALCLISVHAFVKRDAPAKTDENYLQEIQKQADALIKDIGGKLKEAVDPDTIKKNFNDFIDNTKKFIDNAGPKKE